MSAKTAARKRPAKETYKEQEKAPTTAEDAAKRQMAEALFHPTGKSPYYFNGKPLRNIQELADYLEAFSGTEGEWVASWIEYLGDAETARRIMFDTGGFKKIVRDRCKELKKYLAEPETVSTAK